MLAIARCECKYCHKRFYKIGRVHSRRDARFFKDFTIGYCTLCESCLRFLYAYIFQFGPMDDDREEEKLDGLPENLERFLVDSGAEFRDDEELPFSEFG